MRLESYKEKRNLSSLVDIRNANGMKEDGHLILRWLSWMGRAIMGDTDDLLQTGQTESEVHYSEEIVLRNDDHTVLHQTDRYE